MIVQIAELEQWTLAMAVVAMVLTTTMGLVRIVRARAEQNAKRFPPMAPTGTWNTIRAMSSDEHPWFIWRTAQAIGTSVFRLPLPLLGTPMAVVVGDAKLARAIMTDKKSVKPHQLYRSFDWTTNGVKSMFTNNGPFWHARRKGMAPAFSSNHVQRMNAVALAKTDEWIENKLRPLIAQGKSFNVADEMIDLLLAAICETAFQYTISAEEITMFKTELELVLREFLYKTSLNPLRVAFGWLLPEQRRARLAAQRLHGLTTNIVAAYRKLDNPIKGTIIDLICSNPCYKDDQERTADVLVLLVAGHDTTAYSLAWTLKEMALHPELQAELRASAIQAAKEGSEAAPHQLEVVRNTIRESIRLHPVSAVGNSRTVGRDFETKDGKVIPAGSIAFMSIFCMLKDPVVFGKDYDQFNPSRWEKDNVTVEMNQAFIPFAVGRQNCVGQPLAQAELHCILPRIISQFELTVEEEGTVECFLTMKPAGTMLKAQSVTEA